MTTGYAKLFSTLITSTLWRQENRALKLVWVTMLAMADRMGVVESSVPGLSDMAKVSIGECEEALEALRAADKYSRTPDNQGRRIEDVSGGWRILNFIKYSSKMDSEDRRAYQAAWQKEYRKRRKENIREAVCGGARVAIHEGMEEARQRGA